MTFNKLLDFVEHLNNDNTKYALSREGATLSFEKLAKYYDLAVAMLMTETFMDPCCKLKYFEANEWNEGGKLNDATDVNLVDNRVFP